MSLRLSVRAGGELVSWFVDEWSVLVALGALSADPRTKGEFFSALRRYQPNHQWDETGERAAGIEECVAPDGGWCLIDLDSRSVVAGDGFELPERRSAFRADPGEAGGGFPIVWLDTPRDWLFQRAGDDWQSVVAQRAGGDASRERVDTRAILFGRPMLEFVAERVLAAAPEAGDDENSYQLIRAIHADWLMTPRDDLRGKTPREVLLYHHDQIGWDLEHRSEQWTRQGHAPPPLDADSTTYRLGGYGTIEIVTYFDLMRSLLSEAWQRVVEGVANRDLLVERLADHRDEFLNQPPEDSGSGPTCGALIESERRRMPVTDDGGHVVDCDCPICQAAAEGAFGSGPAFMFFDGHHLELEDEFAFSMTESREQWEQDQEDYRSWSDRTEIEGADRQASGSEPDSVWTSSFVDWDNVATGNSPVSAKTAIAFPLAELIGKLLDHRAERPHIDGLNSAFAEFRRAEDSVAQQSAAEELRVCLERVAETYPDLMPRSADLQSRLDEVLRALNGPVAVAALDPRAGRMEPTATTIPPILNVVVFRSPGPSDEEIERESAMHVEDVSPRPLAGGLGYVTLEPADFDRLCGGIVAGDATGTAAAVLHFLGPKARAVSLKPRDFDYCWTTTEETRFGRTLLLQVVRREAEG